MISKSFIKSSLIYTLAGALPMASAVILLPFYILYLPTEVYGSLAICLSMTTLVQIIVTYSFDSSLYIHYHELERDPLKLNSFVSSSFIFIAGLGVLVSVVITFSGQFLMQLVKVGASASFYPYGFISVITGAMQALFKVHGNLLQTREKPLVFLWSNFINFFLVALLTVIGLRVFPETLVGPLGSRFIASSLGAMWVIRRIIGEFGFHLESPWKFTSSSFNVFTFLYQLQQWIVNYIDRYVILIFSPISAIATVGLYEFAVKCLVPIELTLNGLNATLFPRIIKSINSQTIKQSTVEINRYFHGQISVIIIMICAAILVFPPAFEWFLINNRYYESLRYLPYLALIFILRSIRLYFIMPTNILKKMKQLTVLNFFISVLKIGLLIILLGKFGIFGILEASAFSYLLEIVALWFIVKEYYLIRINKIKMLIVPAIVAGLVLLGESIYFPIDIFWVRSIYVSLSYLILLLAYHKEIRLVLIKK